MAFTVDIDLERCQGHGKCMIDCPEVFDTDEQGFAILTVTRIEDTLIERVEQCVSGCPENALAIRRL